MDRRFWEIDSLRGIAVVMMVAFHFLFDLEHFGGYGVGVHSGFWWLFGRLTSTIFLVLVGVSLTISYSRVRGKPGPFVWGKYLKRGTRIFLYGMLITLATWLFLGDGFIIFGVLHLIGVAIMLSVPFLRLGRLSLVPGVAVIILGLLLQAAVVGFPWLLWLGLIPRGFYTFDYFPLLPWLGVVLIGISAGNLVYPNGRRGFGLRDSVGFPPLRFLAFLGRHSLFIYFLHQPVLMAILYAFVF